MNLPSKGILLDILKGSALTVALFLTYATLPIFGLFGGMLVPVPALYFSLRLGNFSGRAIVIISTLFLGLFTEGRLAVVYILQAATVSLMLPMFLGKRKCSTAIIFTAASSIAVMLAVGLTYFIADGINLDSEVLRWLSSGISQTAALYSKSGINDDDLKALQQGLQQAGSIMVRIYPALLVICQTSIVITTMLAIAGFVRRGRLQLTIGEFCEFRNSEYLVWLLIISGFSMLIEHETLARFALNTLLIVGFAYFFQGLAVMASFFTRFTVPAFGRFMFYTFLLLQPYLLAGVAVLGIFDMWANFRAPKQQNL